MRTLRTIIILAVAGLFLTSAASAQAKSSHSEAAMELLSLMKIDRTLTQAIDIALTNQLASNPGMKPYEDVLRAFMAKYMNWANLKEKFAALYMSEFDEQTLRDMIAFYRTPSGQIAVAKLPILMQKGGELGQAEVQAHLPELQEAIQKRQEELHPANQK
jgi:uncharacterized protein